MTGGRPCRHPSWRAECQGFNNCGLWRGPPAPHVRPATAAHPSAPLARHDPRPGIGASRLAAKARPDGVPGRNACSRVGSPREARRAHSRRQACRRGGTPLAEDAHGYGLLPQRRPVMRSPAPARPNSQRPAPDPAKLPRCDPMISRSSARAVPVPTSSGPETSAGAPFPARTFVPAGPVRPALVACLDPRACALA